MCGVRIHLNSVSFVYIEYKIWIAPPLNTITQLGFRHSEIIISTFIQLIW